VIVLLNVKEVSKYLDQFGKEAGTVLCSGLFEYVQNHFVAYKKAAGSSLLLRLS